MQRLVSLDFFRGATIAGMIIVNDPGSWRHVYAPLRHAEWHGVTATDLVFPFFLFILGVSVTLSYSKQIKAGIPRQQMVGKILRRTAIIFGLGLFLSLYPKFEFDRLRVMGVLPLIALVFLACSLLYIYFKPKMIYYLGAGILIFYWLILTYVPTPGLGTVSLLPGENMAHWIDQYITPGRLYRETWDPEGMFSTLPAIVSGITGIAVGELWRQKHINVSNRLMWMFTLGCAFLIVGNLWGWFFPMNKHIWTSSYVLHTSGLATLTFASSIVLIDVLKIRRGTTMCVAFGLNAITAFVLHAWLARTLGIFWKKPSLSERFTEVLINTGFDPKLSSLCWAILFLLVCYLPIWIMHRRKIYLKV